MTFETILARLHVSGPCLAVAASVLAGGCTATEMSSDDDGSGDDACSQSSAEVPSARGDLDMVWDERRGRLVIFGGDHGTPELCQPQTEFVGDTWAFYPECGQFQRIAEFEDGPGPRGRYASAYDPTRNRWLIHGGRFRPGVSGPFDAFDDVWALDLDTDRWSRLIEGGGPAPRADHVAIVADDRLVIHGGVAGDGSAFELLPDAWALDLETLEWEEIVPVSDAVPTARASHGATLVEGSGQTSLLIYGGMANQAFLGDVWALDLDARSWILVSDDDVSSPSGRFAAEVFYEPQTRTVLCWAGHDSTDLGNTNQLWRLDLVERRWESVSLGDELNTSIDLGAFCDLPAEFVIADFEAPERRSDGAAAMTPEGDLWIFAGKTDCGLINDVWRWSSRDEAWELASAATEGEMCLRAFAEGCEGLCF